MATTYGAEEGRLSVGIDVSMSPSTVTSSTTSVTLTWKVYARATYAFNDPQTMTMSNAISDVENYTMVSSNGTTTVKLVWTGTQTVTLNYGSTQSRTLSAAASGLFNGGTPSHSRSITIPARPYAVPAAPSGVNATRNSDTQATITWTRNPTTGAPYSSQTLQMRTWSGSAWSAWGSPVTLSATATSYVKTGLSANRVYGFQVRANNSVGSSSYTWAGTNVFMTPAAPTNVQSAADPDGTSITTTWTPQNYTDTSPAVNFQIERSVNGGAYALVADDVSGSSWQDTSPGAGTNKYRIAAQVETYSLISGFTEGNTVSTIVSPLAPTGLTPNGSTVDLNSNVILDWTHNHGGDGAAQSHFTIEYSTDGGSSWTALVTNVASTATQYTLPGGTLANGATYMWRVKTQGSTTVAFGPFSTGATFTGSSKPTATLTSPTATTETLPLVVAWDYAQDNGSAQVAWEATLNPHGSPSRLQTLSGSGTTSSASFTYAVQDQTEYDVWVRVQSAAGLWSNWAGTSTLIDLASPAGATVTSSYEECFGAVLLHIEPNEPSESELTVDSVIIERRVPGGEWVTLASNLPIPNDFLDTLPVTNGTNEYRITTVSDTPSYQVLDIITVEGTNGDTRNEQWVFLSYGDAFQQVLRFGGEPKISDSSDRVRAAQHFLGRRKPVLLLGTNTTRKISASGELLYDEDCRVEDQCMYDSPPSDWIAAGETAELVCFRDYTGRRVFGMLSGMSVDEGVWKASASVSFDVEETEFTEVYGALAGEEA